MSFVPAVTVLSQQPPVLEPPDLSLAALLAHFPGIDAADAVCITGSTEAGWGNTYSDVDVYTFSDEELVLPVDDSMELWPGSDPSGVSWTTWIGRYGDTRVDLKVWPTKALEIALEPFLGPTEPEFCGVSEDLQDFIYRVSIARALKGDSFLRHLQKLITVSGYPRALARLLKAEAENALTDVAGQLECGDVLTARISAMRAAAYTADSCLVIVGDLCRGQKWLLRRLESTPACGITPDDYRSMVLDGAKSGESHGDCALRIARWAQARLVRVEDDVLATA